jgi:hypothetical protein
MVLESSNGIVTTSVYFVLETSFKLAYYIIVFKEAPCMLWRRLSLILKHFEIKSENRLYQQ